MSRMSISNYLLPISHKQFNAIVAEFMQVAAKVFGGACTIQIRGLKHPKWSPTQMHDDGTMNYIAGVNRRAIIFEQSELSDVTAQMFRDAAYIEVVVSPMNILAAPKFAFAHMEFKGERPRQATMYIQPDDAEDFAAITKNHPMMLVGDGLKANSSPG